MSVAVATKFVKWDVSPLDSLKESRVYRLRERLNNGESMNRAEKNWLAENIRSNSYFSLSVPLMGWRFDFSDVLKKYLVNQYGRWDEHFAPDKTSLRATLYGRVDQIVEIEN